LNDDQKLAISKYEEVLQTLDFARELSGQFKTLIVEEDKTKKKLLKKEQLEKAKSEAQKLAQVLEIQVLFSFPFFISYFLYFHIFDL
jgi:caprin-1